MALNPKIERKKSFLLNISTPPAKILHFDCELLVLNTWLAQLLLAHSIHPMNFLCTMVTQHELKMVFVILQLQWITSCVPFLCLVYSTSSASAQLDLGLISNMHNNGQPTNAPLGQQTCNFTALKSSGKFCLWHTGTTLNMGFYKWMSLTKVFFL